MLTLEMLFIFATISHSHIHDEEDAGRLDIDLPHDRDGADQLDCPHDLDGADQLDCPHAGSGNPLINLDSLSLPLPL